MRIPLLCSLLFVCAASLRAQPVNVRISDPSLRDPEEVSIALNPRNLNELAVGANIRYLFRSSDGGFNWDNTQLNSDYGFWGDPCLTYDDSGVLYYEHLSGANWQDPEFLWRIVVQRSTDNGLNFDGGQQIGYFPPTMQDKAWLGLDRSQTASRGNLYTSWTEFDRYGSKLPPDSSRIYFSMTSDRSLSWSDRVRIDDTAGDCLDGSYTDEGATSAATKDGSVLVAWSARNEIYLDESSDGGKTFGKDRVITDQPGGWDFSIPGVNRANGFAMLASDLNAKSPYYGRVYLMWSDQRRGVTDVYFMHSTDNGASWSPRLQVNSDSSLKHHFFPSLALDPVTARIYIVYYDRRNYDDDRTDVYLAKSIDGGESFSDQKISESVFRPVDSVFFGDYMHIVAHAGHVYPVWMREDFNPKPALSVWTAPLFDSVVALSQRATQTIDAEDDLSVSDNGIHPSFSFSLSQSRRISIELFDLLGRQIQTLLAGDYGAGRYHIGLPASIPSGAYVVRLTAISQPKDGVGGFSSLVRKVVVP